MTPGVAMQLAHELSVIDRCGLAEFFLINWDIVRFCKEQRIPAQGRGSAADSIVAYVLDITKVDPIEHELLFERFLTEDSRTMPDIDLDIASNDREEVIQYVYKKYGERYAAMVCNVVTYQARSASREIAKALGFRDETVDRMAKSIDQYHVHPAARPSAAQHPAYKHPNREAEHGWEDGAPVAERLEDLASFMDEKERTRFPLFRELTLAIAELPAAPLDPQRRHAHHRAAARGHRADRARDDAGPQRGPVRQARRRGPRPGEDGPPRAAHALAHQGRRRRHRGAARRASRARHHRARRRSGLRPHLRGRHHRPVPGGEPRAGAGAAARASALLRGHRRRGRDHPARPAAGEHGESVHQPPAGPRAGDVRASAARADPERDARRDPLPGADPPRLDGRRRFLARAPRTSCAAR